MNVQISERAQQRLEALLEEGAFPSAEAAIEAAIEQLADPWFGIDVAALELQATKSRAAGTIRELDAAYEAELKAKLDAIVSSHLRPA